MKITATYSRKTGMPNYGSISAGCTVEIDLGKAADGDRVRESILSAYSIATAAVEEQIRDQLLALTPDLVEPEPEREPEPEPQPARRPEPPRGTEYRRPGQPAAGGFDPDRPTDGRQLLAMLRRWTEEDGTDYLPGLGRWAKRQDFDWKVVNWGPDDVAEALDYLAGQRKQAAQANGHTSRRAGR